MQLSMVCPTSPHTGMYWGIGGGSKVISFNFTPGLGELVILVYGHVLAENTHVRRSTLD